MSSYKSTEKITSDLLGNLEKKRKKLSVIVIIHYTFKFINYFNIFRWNIFDTVFAAIF